MSDPPIGALAPDAFAVMIGNTAPEVKRAAATNGPRGAVDAFFGTICPGLWGAIDERHKDRYRGNADMLSADLAMPPYQIQCGRRGHYRCADFGSGRHPEPPGASDGSSHLGRLLGDARLLELDCGHVTYPEQPADFARGVATLTSETAFSSGSGRVQG